jgi:hypothetical protein
MKAGPTIAEARIPMAKQLEAILKAQAATERNYDNPFNLPVGFYKVFTVKDEHVGFGFYCQKCKLNYPIGAPEEIRHCGTVSRFPTGLRGWLAKLWLKSHTMVNGV